MIRNTVNHIVKELYEFINLPVVPFNVTERKPVYPFVAWNIVTAYIPKPYQKEFVTREVKALDDRFEVDILETETEQAEMTISFNAYGKTQFEALEVVNRLNDFFRNLGYEKLVKGGVVVIEVTPTAERSTLIVDHYEHRYGFDVRFRFIDKTEQRFETIETVEIQEGKYE